jgi:NAD+ kinase
LAQKTSTKKSAIKTNAVKTPTKAGFAPKTVCIMYRPDTKEAIRQSNELSVWLKEQGFTVYSALNQSLKKPALPLTPAKMNELDWVIVLGGDGTYLGAVRMLEGRQVPILGVNMGSLGFLTEIRIEDLYKSIISTLQHKMDFKVRSMLSVRVKRGGKLAHEYVALNDAVIERGSNTHLINIEVFNETQLVAAVKADALVVATPTGSTAYNLAAGGPILHPDVNAIVMTPVCPHALTSRPLIFPDDQKLSFKLVTQDKRVVLTVDGVHRGEITPDDEIIITRSPIDHFVIRKPTSNYFTLLREKLAFGQRN